MNVSVPTIILVTDDTTVDWVVAFNNTVLLNENYGGTSIFMRPVVFSIMLFMVKVRTLSLPIIVWANFIEKTCYSTLKLVKDMLFCRESYSSINKLTIIEEDTNE
jgi:hypothetical protein